MAANNQVGNDFIATVGFDFLDHLVYSGISEQAIIDAIQRRAGGPGRIDSETATYVLYRYTLFRNAGLRLQNRNDNSTAGSQFIPIVYGCEGPYEYYVVVPMDDPENDRHRDILFIVRSDVPLGKYDVQREAGSMAFQWAHGADSSSDPTARSETWQQTGEARITAAGRCRQE